MTERLAAYFDHAASKGWVKVGAEVDMQVVLGRAEIRGSVDRLERLPDGRLRVVDYKTGSGRPTKAEVPSHPQLGVYQLGVDAGALAEYGTESAGAALLQLGSAANKGVTLDEQPALREADDPQWAADLVAGTAEGMAGATFLAQVNDFCSMCPVRSCCPAWPEGRVL
jgi:RecB family exonuclease